MTFRSSQYCSRYDFCSFQLESALETPAGAAVQTKVGHKFSVDNFGETNSLDWHNAYIEADVVIKKADGTNYAAADEAAPINGIHGLIERLQVYFRGVSVVNTPSVNHAINLKNMIE